LIKPALACPVIDTGESSLFPLGQVPPQRGFYPGGRPFWAGGNLDSRPVGERGGNDSSEIIVKKR